MAMNFVTFNQDYSHMAVGTSSGFRIYYTEPFQKCHETNDGDIALLEMLFSTSLIALVRSPRCLVITNTKRSSTICELTFPSTILAVRLNRKRLVVVSEDFIYLYDISNMKLVNTIDTSPNPHGICALSPSSDRCYLAYPLPSKLDPGTISSPSHVPPSSPHVANTTGKVNIIDAMTMYTVAVIEAHRAPLSHITMNKEGTRLATASDKGTIIRVFSVPEGRKIFQFRRGTMPARILSMAFNAASTLLCVSSATDTVHIFRLSTPAEVASEQSQPRGLVRKISSISERSVSPTGTRMDGKDGGDGLDSSIAARKHNGTFAGMIRRTSQTVGKSFAATVGSYLPSAVSEMLEPARDFAWFKLPRVPGSSGTVRSVVAMNSSQPQVMVATSDGQFLVFTIDLDTGGEAHLTSQHSILERDERPGRSFLED